MIDDFNSNPERCLYCNKLHKNWKNGLFDGVNYARVYVENSGSNTWYDNSGSGTKFGITNTLYYYNNSSQTNRRGFSGIQIK